jgi:NADP-dependent 3-hydroxy acid dehydrogenase YdfG
LRLAREGARLALVARNEAKLTEVRALAEKAGAVASRVYPCDMTQADALEGAVNAIIADFGGVDILINNAGVWQKKSPLDQIEKDVIDSVVATNLTALIHITRLLLPTLRSRKEAAILNVSSKSGMTAQEGQSVYSATKWGVRGFTEVLKVDLKDTPVRVAGLYQGGTNTDLFKKAGEEFSTESFTEPKDLADLVAYMLAVPEKMWIHEVSVDR